MKLQIEDVTADSLSIGGKVYKLKNGVTVDDVDAEDAIGLLQSGAAMAHSGGEWSPPSGNVMKPDLEATGLYAVPDFYVDRAILTSPDLEGATSLSLNGNPYDFEQGVSAQPLLSKDMARLVAEGLGRPFRPATEPDAGAAADDAGTGDQVEDKEGEGDGAEAPGGEGTTEAPGDGAGDGSSDDKDAGSASDGAAASDKSDGDGPAGAAPAAPGGDVPPGLIKHVGGGWYELSNGEKVQGKDEAEAAAAALLVDGK